MCVTCAAVGFAESLRFDLLNLNARGVRSLVVCPYAVATGMFDGIFEKTYGFLHRLLLPVLTEKQVSAATLNGIANGLEVSCGACVCYDMENVVSVLSCAAVGATCVRTCWISYLLDLRSLLVSIS